MVVAILIFNSLDIIVHVSSGHTANLDSAPQSNPRKRCRASNYHDLPSSTLISVCSQILPSPETV